MGKKPAARKQFAEKPFLVNIYGQGSSKLKILLTFLAEGGREHGMDIPRNLVLIISLVQGRACMRIETLGGIAKRNGNGPSGGPSLILEGFRQSYLKIPC